jgi:hypothetical protein
MILLSEHALSHIVGGHYLDVLTRSYTTLAAILVQRPVNVIEATCIYQAWGHRVGEFVYTTLHPEPIANQT